MSIKSLYTILTVQSQTHITLPIEQLSLLLEKVCDLKNEVAELREDREQLKDLKKELLEFKQNVKNINKALAFKTKQITQKEKDDDFLKTFRASQIIKI